MICHLGVSEDKVERYRQLWCVVYVSILLSRQRSEKINNINWSSDINKYLRFPESFKQVSQRCIGDFLATRCSWVGCSDHCFDVLHCMKTLRAIDHNNCWQSLNDTGCLLLRCSKRTKLWVSGALFDDGGKQALDRSHLYAAFLQLNESSVANIRWRWCFHHLLSCLTSLTQTHTRSWSLILDAV